MSQKVVLVIMDGWGIARDPKVSAIEAAQTPFYDESLRICLHARLYASEQQVGLPAGQMGNSEVGHTNIGAGRVVYQDLVRIGRGHDLELFGRENAADNFAFFRFAGHDGRCAGFGFARGFFADVQP